MIYTNFSDRIVALDASLEVALKVINAYPEQRTAFVIENNKFLGLITDGDIRRALLENKSIRLSVSEVYNNNPVFFSKANKVQSYDDNRVYPIVEQGVLTGYYYNKFDFKTHKIKVLIMAGGFGTRLRPLTDDIPKPMIEVGNKPILQIIMEELQAQGVNDFIFSTHYLPKFIRSHFGDGSKFNTNIEYLHEEEPLGTGGAITLFKEDSDLIVTNGDVLTQLNYAKLCQYHFDNELDITLCVRDFSYQVPFGVVYGGKRIDSVVEKPVVQYLINSGIYVLSSKVVKKLKLADTPFDIPAKINEFIGLGYKVGKYHFEDFWLDIGSYSELEKAKQVFAGEKS